MGKVLRNQWFCVGSSSWYPHMPAMKPGVVVRSVNSVLMIGVAVSRGTVMGREAHSVARADSSKVVVNDILEVIFGVGDAVVETDVIAGSLWARDVVGCSAS